MEPLDNPPASATDEPRLDSRRSTLRVVPWRWSDVLIGSAPLLLPRLTPALLGWVPPSAVPRWLWLPLTLLILAWMFVYPARVARRRTGWPQLPRARAVVIEAACALLALPAVLVAQTLIIQALVSVFGPSAWPTAPLEPIARSPRRFESLAFTLLVVLVAPVAEEVFFRGLLYNALRQRLRPLLAVPLQAVVFGLLHPFGLADSTAVALVGLALAVVYEWRKTLLSPVVLHALLNVVGLVAMAWGLTLDANAPRLGVRGDPYEGGCRVTEVVPGGAAAAAGLQVGDVVTAVDGEAVADLRAIARVVRRKRVGDEVTIEFRRGGKAHRDVAVLKRRQE